MKGIRIEKGPNFWHVCIKMIANNQGYVEVGKFITIEAAFDFAKKKSGEAMKEKSHEDA